MEGFERRMAAVQGLMGRSESDLEAFFFSLGLGEDFRGPAAGWGRQKRVLAALSSAEQRGDLEGVLDLADQHFALGLAGRGSRASERTKETAERRQPEPTSDHFRQRPSPASSTRTVDDSVTDVFVVHGHDRSVREQVARLIERAGGGQLQAVVLEEQPNQGRTIVEKFEHFGSSAGFAVVLLTADDLGQASSSSSAQAPRARQNVLLELGYFVGVLGRNRVALLMEPGVEAPSDISGVLYTEIDSAGAWKHKLVREMEAAGLPVDYSSIP